MCPQGPLKANTSTLTHRDELPFGAGCTELCSALTLVHIRIKVIVCEVDLGNIECLMIIVIYLH